MPACGLFSVFIGNLDKSTTQSELSDLFMKFGTPKKLYIADKPGSYTYGFVRFVRRDSAKDAIMEMHGTLWKGRQLQVELSNENPCASELNQELRQIRSGDEYRDKQHVAVASLNAEKLLALKIAIREHNQSDTNGPPLDAYSLLSELNKIPVKLPPSEEDNFSFNSLAYFARLKEDYKNPPSKRNERITPLQQSDELLALGLPWVAGCKQTSSANGSHTQKTGNAVAMDSKPSQPPSADLLEESPTPSTSSLQSSECPQKPAFKSSPPVSEVSVKRVSRMPDLVMDHQSATSGYSSGSSADEMTMEQNGFCPLTKRLPTNDESQRRLDVKHKPVCHPVINYSSLQKAPPVTRNHLPAGIISAASSSRISASEQFRGLQLHHPQAVQTLDCPSQRSCSDQPPPLLPRKQLNHIAHRRPPGPISQYKREVLAPVNRTVEPRRALRVVASNGRGKQLLAQLLE